MWEAALQSLCFFGVDMKIRNNDIKSAVWFDTYYGDTVEVIDITLDYLSPVYTVRSISVPTTVTQTVTEYENRTRYVSIIEYVIRMS